MASVKVESTKWQRRKKVLRRLELCARSCLGADLHVFESGGKLKPQRCIE